MHKINFGYFILFSLSISCSLVESNSSSLENEVEIQAIAKTDSAKYVESLLYFHLENANDSMRAIAMLKDIMSKKFIGIESKKNEKDSIQIPLYCDDKPISFYFTFENKQLIIGLFDGKDSSKTKINNISIGSVPKNKTNKDEIHFCFGFGYEEDNHFYSGCEFSGFFHPNKERVMLWRTPKHIDELWNYLSEEQINLYKTYKVGCE